MEKQRTQTGRRMGVMRKNASSNLAAAAACQGKPRYVALFNGPTGSLSRKLAGLEDPLKKVSDTESSSGNDTTDSEQEEAKPMTLHSLSALICEYLLENAAPEDHSNGKQQQAAAEKSGLRNGSEKVKADAGAGPSGSDGRDLQKAVEDLAHPMTPLEIKLKFDVEVALESAAKDAERRHLLCQVDPEDCGSAKVRRRVVSRLRALGYNAGICKAQWQHSKGFPGGIYEYIDVMGSVDCPMKKPGDRVMVDTDFRAQFAIARPTPEFESLLEALPLVFVGPRIRLETAVALMASATKRSMAKSGMQVPPWRKIEYIRAKWLSPYERITNFVATSPASTSTSIPSTSSQSIEAAEGEGASQESAWAAWSPVVFNSSDLATQSTAPSSLAAKLPQSQKENLPAETTNREDGGPEGRVVKGSLYSKIHQQAVLEDTKKCNAGVGDVCVRGNQQWQLPLRQKSSQAQGTGKGMSALAAALVKAGLSAMSKQQSNGDLGNGSEKTKASEIRRAPLLAVAGIMIM